MRRWRKSCSRLTRSHSCQRRCRRDTACSAVRRTPPLCGTQTAPPSAHVTADRQPQRVRALHRRASAL
jgi:hypothetical protein